MSLNLDTEYRIRGLNYPNLDFDISISTDARAYYTQRLRISILGKFEPGIEICAKIQSLGIVGSSSTLTDFLWQKSLPYPKTDFYPFIENVYFKISDFGNAGIKYLKNILWLLAHRNQ